jgi:CRP/FNR family transcriptional regulator/CRP/FNR family cyclic AMP-dependent transcriptional regulator
MATPKGRPEDQRLSLPLLMQRSWERPKVRDWEEVLRALPLFANLSGRHVRQVAKLAEFVEFAPGDFIVQAGEPGYGFYLILSGRAKVLGRPRARNLEPGDFFGEMALIDGEPRSATVTATTDVHAMMLPRRPFLRVLQQEPRIALTLLAELASRVRRLEGSA